MMLPYSVVTRLLFLTISCKCWRSLSWRMQLDSALASPGNDPKALQHGTLWSRDGALDKKCLDAKKSGGKKLT